MENQTLSTIAARRSHRKYADTQVTNEQLQAILDAGLQSPSAVNRQPWHFTVIQDKTIIDTIDRCAHETAQKQQEGARSPRFMDPGFHVFYHAPTVIVLSGEDDFHWTEVDCGIAVQNMALAAESVGLGSVIIGMIRGCFMDEHKETLEKALRFPNGYRYVIAIAIGTPLDEKSAHPIKENKVTFL